jgi:hypothetical protein
MYDYKMVDLDFNLENTINENDVLKKNNRLLRISTALVLLAAIGSVIAIMVTNSLEEKAKQRN